LILQLAFIVIFCVTEEHTPVDVLKELHDPDVIVKPLKLYPILLHVTISEAVPLHLLCDVGVQVPPFSFTVILYLGQ
jgi:hypothetical protein